MNHDFSENDKEYYSQGSCHEFAIAMHRLYGTKFIIAFSDNVFDGSEEENEQYDIIHVYAWDDKTDMLYDVFGSIPIQEMRDNIENRFMCDIYETDYCYSEKELSIYIDSENNYNKQLTSFEEKDIEEAKNKILQYGLFFKDKSIQPSGYNA